ncbi:hypothetical protein ACFFYR_34790 [Paraburkholderia dipogonis]|uniref:hypothetical protein n=1 Tax=Paraburkholderia dipogonis TaxID=1211383 RepID=UPI0035E70A7B
MVAAPEAPTSTNDLVMRSGESCAAPGPIRAAWWHPYLRRKQGSRRSNYGEGLNCVRVPRAQRSAVADCSRNSHAYWRWWRRKYTE